MNNVKEETPVITLTPQSEDFVRMEAISFEDWCEAKGWKPEDIQYANNEENPERPWIIVNGKREGQIGDISGNRQLIVLQSKYDPQGAYMQELKKAADTGNQDAIDHYKNALNKTFCLLMRSQFGDTPKGSLMSLLGGEL